METFGEVQIDRLLSLDKTANNMLFAFLIMNVINNVLLTTLIGIIFFFCFHTLIILMNQLEKYGGL